MPKSKHRKKHSTKKNSKKKEILQKKKNLKFQIDKYEKIMKSLDQENNEQRKANMDIVRKWGDTEETLTPTQQMLMS